MAQNEVISDKESFSDSLRESGSNSDQKITSMKKVNSTSEGECSTSLDEGRYTENGNSSNNDTDDEEEEEEDPPLLKYTRITKLPKNFFKRDSISACLFHEKLFGFATHSGLLHLTKPDFTVIRTFKCHRSSITSIHSDGEYFATSSIDGTVVVGSILNPSDILACDFKRPVHSVVLDQNYKSTKTFVSGGMAGEVILSQRNWLGNRVDICLEKGDGAIVGIHTVDDIIFWMNDAGITFYSIPSKKKLLNVAFPIDDIAARPDLYWPSVHFPETDRIVIAWAHHVWTFKISLTRPISQSNPLGSILSSAASSLRAVPDKKIELEHHLTLPLLVAGAVSFKDDQLLCLELPLTKQKDELIDVPELNVLDLFTGEEMHNDKVVSKNYQNLNVNDYHLGKYIGKSATEYYLISSNDAICVHELSLKDRFDWYVENENYLKAWEIGAYAVSIAAKFEVGLKYIQEELGKKDWASAASSIHKIFTGTDVSESDTSFVERFYEKWEEMIMFLVDKEKVKEIAPFIPQNPQFSHHLYDAVLLYYFNNGNLEEFSYYLHLWSTDLFDTEKFESLMEEKAESEESTSCIREELVYLLLEDHKYLQVIPHLLKLKDVRALDVLLSQNIISTFLDDIVEIVLLPYHGSLKDLPKLSMPKLDLIFSKPLELLVQSRHSISMDFLISKFSKPEELKVLLFLYMKKVSQKEPLLMASYGDYMVELYFEFDHTGLLYFLKSNTNYDLDKAIKICESDDKCYNELIYLWGRMGESKKALSLIIDRLDNPQLAIAFVKESSDVELWEFLVDYSMNRPKFIKELLNTYDDFRESYAEIIKKLPESVEVDGLQSTLNNVCRENFLSLNVNSGVFKIVDDETKEYAMEFLQLRELGKVFDVEKLEN
ncbi:LAFE_0H10616g1_1 [Lachancea fermentati]|uniref:Vacuolar protein sorting-associated protein 41 n=1 Tax=Lachancea fermentati TaxID=4955 RepID=A0A1G4MKH0_LACFM|nr:LAFE_0H10616g1_1 [Lachancea fermentati]